MDYFQKPWLLPDHFQQNDVGYKTTDSQVLTPKKGVCISKDRMPFSATSFNLGNLSSLTSFQKLRAVSDTVTIAHFR